MAANAKYVILKAKVENEIVELFAKSSVNNVYLEDGVTTLASKLAEMMVTLGNKADSTAVTQQISDAIDALIDGAPGTYDTLKEISDFLTSHQDAYTALVETIGTKASTEVVNGVIERVNTLETKMSTIAEGAQVNVIEKIFVNGVEQSVSEKGVNIAVPTGTMASKNSVAEADLDEALAKKINDASAANHGHDNKAELDKIAEGDKQKWDEAAAKAHEHANKAELDKIAEGDKAKWDAKANVYIQAAQPTDLASGDVWVQLVELA